MPDSGCGSWLFEPQSTNLITQSELFSDSSWAKIGTSVTSGFSSPSGNLTAFKLVENSANSIHQINVGTPANGDDYSFSVFVKKGEREFVSLVFSDLIRYLSQYTFDLTNGVITKSYSRSGVTSTFTSIYMGNGWYKLTLSSNYLSWGTNVFPRLFIENTATPPTVPSNTYQGDGTSGLYIWGAMLEQNSFSTSYIPTEGSQVTRNQDLCNNGGSLASINSTEGVLYAEISSLNGDSDSNRTISLSDSTNGNQIRFYFPINIEGQIKIRVDVGGSTIYIFDYNITTSETPIKLAFRYSPNGMDFYGNGSLVSSSALAPSFTNNLNSLQFRRGDGQFGEDFFGKTKALAVWKEALSDAELTESNNNIMNIYKTNFPTEQEGKDYLLSIGVLVETDNEIVFSKDTAAVVYIGKVVKIPATYDADGNIITPAVYYDGYAIDVMSSLDLDFGGFMVYPIEAAHSFYGYPRNAEVPK